MKVNKIAERAAKLAWEKKGNDIIILDVRKLTDVTDYFVVVTGESEPHVKAISDYLEEKLNGDDLRVWHKEGYNNLNWVLLDYIEVVVHIFREQTRQFYSFEKLWGDARIIRVEDDAKDRITFTEQN